MHKPTPATQSEYWSRLLAPYTRPVARKAWFQLLMPGALVALNGYLMLLSLRGPYWLTLLAALPAAGDLDRRGLGDIGTLTVREYLELSWWGRLKYRVCRNPLVLLVFGPSIQFILKHRLPLGIPRTWKSEWASVMWTNLGLAIVTALAWVLIGIERFLLVQVPIYRLKECFRRVPELQRVSRLTIPSSLRCARLHLWDEDEGRLVSFQHLRALRAGA